MAGGYLLSVKASSPAAGARSARFTKAPLIARCFAIHCGLGLATIFRGDNLMGALILMGAYVVLSVLFLVVAGFIGYGAETWAPGASTLIFLAGCASALAGAWPLAVFLTRGWETKE